MRLLADENLEAGIIARLREDGHDVYAVAERTPRLRDEDVLMTAVDDVRVLITNDKDFAALAFLQGKVSQGIVLLRMPRLATEAKAKRLAEVVQDPAARTAGLLTVVEADAIRRRPYPSAAR